ncbi:MAG: GDSL-type esterase/lipase family protein [Elsteraceae bacterium]
MSPPAPRVGAAGRLLSIILATALLASCAIERPTPGPAPTPSVPRTPGSPSLPGAYTPVGPPVPNAPAGLAQLYDGLDRLRAGPTGQDEKLRVLLLGDSHVAGGIITQRLRDRFQADFGDAGRGPMVPGLPYAGRREADWKLTQSNDWSFENSLRSAASPFSLTGFIARSRGGGATMTVAATGEGFDEVEVSFVRRSGGGAFEIRVDDRTISRVETGGSFPTADRVLLPTPPNSRRLELRVVDRRPVELLSWGVEQKKRGVIVEGHGVSGATSWIMQKWDSGLLAEDLRRRDPALILLAFGTNEGFQTKFDPDKYAADYTQIIRLMQEAAPRAAIVLVGPPDAARRGGRAAASGAAPGAAPGAGCGWATPANLFAARSAQQQLAATLNVAFWDWSALMSGPCGVHDWVTRAPPLARPDHVHLTHPGYVATADAMYQDLVAPYLAARGLSARQPLR